MKIYKAALGVFGSVFTGLAALGIVMYAHPPFFYRAIQEVSQVEISNCVEEKKPKKGIPEKELEEKILTCAINQSHLYLIPSTFNQWRVLRKIRKEIKKDYSYTPTPPLPSLEDKPQYFDRAMHKKQGF